MLDNAKTRTNDVLNNISGDAVGWIVSIFIVVLILLSVTVAILDTVAELRVQYGALFYQIEVFTLAIFTVEYGLRVWSCTVEERFRSPLSGRLLYILTPIALIDFVAIFPSYITLAVGTTAVDFLILRSVRLLRILRVFKLGRYNDAFETIKNVLSARRGELFVVFFIAGIVIILA